MLQQHLSAAPRPQVEAVRLVAVAEVGRVVGELVLDAGPRREGVTAAERNAVHQVLALHVAPQATAMKPKHSNPCVCYVLFGHSADPLKPSSDPLTPLIPSLSYVE